jgi:hypothetical protein
VGVRCSSLLCVEVKAFREGNTMEATNITHDEVLKQVLFWCAADFIKPITFTKQACPAFTRAVSTWSNFLSMAVGAAA